MAAATTVSVGRTRTGYCVRIEGRGTLRESPAVHAFADWMLADPANDLVLDLSACDYVDSTFMGCMAWLQRRFGGPGRQPGRVAFVVPPPTGRRAIETMHLESVLNLIPSAPPLVGASTVIPAPELSPEDLGRHILECHRRLVEIDTGNEAIFGPIVARLARDFEKPKG
jgi:anti-anti-sigma regulatory factor